MHSARLKIAIAITAKVEMFGVPISGTCFFAFSGATIPDSSSGAALSLSPISVSNTSALFSNTSSAGRPTKLLISDQNQAKIALP